MNDYKARFVFYLGMLIFVIGLIFRHVLHIERLEFVTGLGSGLVFAAALYQVYLNIKNKR